MSDIHAARHGLENLLASLSGKQAASSEVSVQILPQAGHINLRGNPQNDRFVMLAGDALGQALPLDANTMSIGAYRVYWLAPGEWQVITPLADRNELIGRLRATLVNQTASVVDISGGQLVMHISGRDTRRLLAKGCTLDFNSEQLKTGVCAQSGLANVNILIGLLEKSSTFELIVRRSFAEYLILWLQHSGAEFNINFC